MDFEKVKKNSLLKILFLILIFKVLIFGGGYLAAYYFVSFIDKIKDIDLK